MKYKLRYRIRDWVFRRLFPTIAMHEAHLVDDCISQAIRIKELETGQKGYTVEVETGTSGKTIYETRSNRV